jgi:hypothetical protein
MRKLAAAVVTTLTTLAAVVVATPARAAGTCSLIVPAKVSLSTPYRGITARLGSDCFAAGVTYASWYGYHPTQGLQDIVVFDGTGTTIWDLYDYHVLSRRDWRPSTAHDSNYNDVTQNRPVADIRVGSAAAISSSRSGGRVTVRVSVARYSPSLNRAVPWGGTRGTVQWRSSPSATWRNLRSVYPDKNGRASFAYAAPVRQYRVVFPDASLIWGTTSGVTRR